MHQIEEAIGMGVAWMTTAALVIGIGWAVLVSLAYFEAFFGATSYVI